MANLKGMLVVGGLLAALGSGCDKVPTRIDEIKAEEAKANITLEDVRAFYHEALPEGNNAYRIEASDKQGMPLGEMVLVDRLKGDTFRHGWFECPAGCKAITNDDGTVTVYLSGQSGGQ